MAEPINNWQAFRQYYSRDNPGRPVQEASIAWTEYKAKHGIETGSTKKASTKRSQPRKSPTRTITSPKRSNRRGKEQSPVKRSPPKTHMQAMIPSTLVGLPPELLGYVTRHLPSGSVGVLQLLSRGMKGKTQHALVQLCQELPTTNEVIQYIRSRLQVDKPISVDILVPSNKDMRSPKIMKLEMLGVYSLFAPTNQFTAFVPGTTNVVIHPNTSGLSVKTELDEGFANPFTLLGALRRRESCRKEYFIKYNNDEYGVNIVREYIRATVTPLLSSLVDVDASRVFDANVPVLKDEDIVLLPIPEVNRMIYTSKVAFLGVLLAIWLNTPLGNVFDSFGDNVDLTENEEMQRVLKMRVRMIHQRYVEVLEMMEPLDSLQPDGREVAQYMRAKLLKKEPFRIGFIKTMYSQGPSITTSEVHNVRSIARDVIETYTYIGGERIRIRDHTSTVDIKYMIQNESVHGNVDPHTLRAILEIRGAEIAQEDARTYFADRCRPHINNFSHSITIRNNEEVVVREGANLTTKLLGTTAGSIAVLVTLLHWAGADSKVIRKMAEQSIVGNADVALAVRVFQLYTEIYQSI